MSPGMKVAVVLLAALAFWIAVGVIVYVVSHTITQVRRRRWVRRNSQPMELGPDPLDPHGDGTLRPGDPMFELILASGGAPISARRDEANPHVWHVVQNPPTGRTFSREQLREMLESGRWNEKGC